MLFFLSFLSSSFFFLLPCTAVKRRHKGVLVKAGDKLGRAKAADPVVRGQPGRAATGRDGHTLSHRWRKTPASSRSAPPSISPLSRFLRGRTPSTKHLQHSSAAAANSYSSPWWKLRPRIELLDQKLLLFFFSISTSYLTYGTDSLEFNSRFVTCPLPIGQRRPAVARNLKLISRIPKITQVSGFSAVIYGSLEP